MLVVVVVLLLWFSCRDLSPDIGISLVLWKIEIDSNNSLEVYTPKSFIHLLYNSPHMDIIGMHSIDCYPK